MAVSWHLPRQDTEMKRTKKLELNQETLKNLLPAELQDVKGGFATGTCVHTCGTCPTNCACPPPRE